MKTICLIRHAKSGRKNDSAIKDFDRPLEARGQKDAVWIGKYLKKSGLGPQIMISSPAKRALHTAQLVAKQINYQPEKILIEPVIYASSVRGILNIIRNIDERYERVVLCGHNPSISKLLNYLSESQSPDMPTAGIACLRFEVNSWKKISRKKGKTILLAWPPGSADG